MIGKYILSVIAASLLISICKLMLPKNSVIGAVSKLICGTILVIAIFIPFKNIELYDVSSFYYGIEDYASVAVQEGSEITRVKLCEVIKERVTSYIFDKAAAQGVNLEVEVLLSDDKIPELTQIRMKGDISPYSKHQLIQSICNDLNIAEDNIQWN